MDFSIDGEEVSHSPRTQEKPANTQILEKIQHQPTQQPQPQPHPQPSENESKEEVQGCRKFLSLTFYQKYFQVSQQEVVQRIKLNFIPIRRDFIEKIRPNPDLYGPFWLLTTIVFLLGATGNLARYFQNWSKSDFLFRLELVRYAVILVYSFGFGVPGLLYLVLRFMKCDTVRLPELICIYGYSFGCFVLVFLLCIVPAVWLHWLLMVYGTLNSIAFLVLNLTEYLESLEKKSYVVYGIIGAAQIFLFLMFKLVFFDLIYETPE